MSKTWSKEDRHSFEKSEVMQGLETIVLDTLKRADILQEKIAQSTSADVSATAKEFENLAEKARDAKDVVESVMLELMTELLMRDVTATQTMLVMRLQKMVWITALTRARLLMTLEIWLQPLFRKVTLNLHTE